MYFAVTRKINCEKKKSGYSNENSNCIQMITALITQMIIEKKYSNDNTNIIQIKTVMKS